MHSKENHDTTQPFLRWVGGKRKVAQQLTDLIPSGLNNYYEPFLGGGALFFNVKHMFNKCFLSDINLDLVTSYNSIKRNPSEISNLYENHNNKHSKEYYSKICNNNCLAVPADITARFLYINLIITIYQQQQFILMIIQKIPYFLQTKTINHLCYIFSLPV